jgi:hypothetical protein
MSITPLFSETELDSQISAYKKALTALASAQSYVMEFDGERRQLNRADLPEIRRTLEWLQGQRATNAIGSGPQSFAGRVFRGRGTPISL